MKVENIKELYVIDASFLLAFIMPDEDSKDVPHIFDKYAKGTASFIAPKILFFEVINAIVMAVKRKRLKENDAEKVIFDFLSIAIEYTDVFAKELLYLAIEKNFSVYDVSYLSLAKQKRIPLLTLDEKLKKLV